MRLSFFSFFASVNSTIIRSGTKRFLPQMAISSGVPVMARTAATSPYLKGEETADFGDFAKDWDEETDIEEVAEPWANYDLTKTSRVFYPICVGEVLEGRYLIEHKIGAGGFSTVWMAHDLQDKKEVALKVMSSDEYAERETRMQDEIIRNVQDTSHLVTYLATFLLRGYECYHRVLVFPLMGPCLHRSMLRNLSMATRMSAARQLLVAVDNLHKAGIVHRGE